MNTKDIGEIGEQIAADFLTKKGYRIVERNYRAGRGEIDIIAWVHDRLLVFVEVKTRNSELFGGPEGAVTAAKQNRLLRTAGFYMESIGYDWEIRFDVIAVMFDHGALRELRHIEDAFFPTF